MSRASSAICPQAHVDNLVHYHLNQWEQRAVRDPLALAPQRLRGVRWLGDGDDLGLGAQLTTPYSNATRDQWPVISSARASRSPISTIRSSGTVSVFPLRSESVVTFGGARIRIMGSIFLSRR